ncbi:PRK06851 family protein [Candidatus Desulforudis audaxviator]|uniref:ATPase n=1 Tax=Desulforudis audaxviator (strain MP104C) TaxID=477974 RepID=B1I0Y4_DESAP|nr:PRK06851 family protein [Candidatus Desulforudis audaxviator]ACA58707.1 ATPase [Candidatus Desulforudis audaxviator MP104C]AZK58708.1 ATPase component BioM of energizing module of biotin ECF transporter [Candidatus Desulforudis audaxviator]
MGTGRIKHVFPGGNTSLGFFSYYDHLTPPDATRVFILKGGPGVGKSSFMRKIGEEMRSRGFDIEHHHCSSDNDSLDGVVIPAAGVALLDGTAPHVVDPVNPGAVSEIIHLGDYWNEAKLRAAREQILAVNRRLGRLFATAYSQLAEAKVIRDEMESYVTESMRFAPVNQLTADLTREILGERPGRYEAEPWARHLFRSAVSPDGVVHHIGSLLTEVKQLYLLKGRPGSGRSTLVEAVARAAHARGLDTEVYHCALEPHRADLVVIPAVRAAVLKDVEEVAFQPGTVPGLRVAAYDLDVFLDRSRLAQYEVELMSAGQRFTAALNRAVWYIGEAKKTHDQLETFYIPAMDFTAVDRRRDEVLKRILAYASEAGQEQQQILTKVLS